MESSADPDDEDEDEAYCTIVIAKTEIFLLTKNSDLILLKW